MPEERKPKLQRLIELANRLTGSKGLTVVELGGTTSSSARRIQRDLDTLRDCGFSIDNASGAGRAPAYYINSPRNPAALLNLEETLALTLTTEMAGSSPTAQLAKSAWNKLHYAVVNGQERRLKNDLPAHITAESGDQLPLDLLQRISQSLLNQEILRFTYKGLADEAPRVREVAPTQLFFQDRWYLESWDLESDSLKNFRLDRILELDVLPDSGRLRHRQSGPGSFHPWDLVDSDPVTVTFTVDEPLARWLLENPAHPSQTVDGLEVTLVVRDLQALVRWMCSLTYCQVQNPPQVREMLLHRLKAIADNQVGRVKAKPKGSPKQNVTPKQDPRLKPQKRGSVEEQ